MIWKLLAVFIIGMGVLCLYWGVDGIITGEIYIASKRSEFTALQSNNPGIFWGAIIFYVAGGLYLVRLGYAVIKE